jgi:hypothetical protein
MVLVASSSPMAQHQVSLYDLFHDKEDDEEDDVPDNFPG